VANFLGAMSSEAPETVEGGGLEEWWKSWVSWIMEHPWDFVYYLCICLSPLFVISFISSWKLFKTYHTQGNKDKKRSPKKSTTGGNKGKPSRTLRSNAGKTD